MLKSVLILLNIKSKAGMTININVLILLKREVRSICPLKSLKTLKANIPYCIKLIANINIERYVTIKIG